MEFYSPPLTRARARKVGTLSQQPKVKARSFDVISRADTASTSSIPDQSVNCEVKKVKLSKDELEMNGVPAGDIFDIKVLFDNELVSLAHPKFQMDSALSVLNKISSTWAERYGAIEVMRRSTLFSPVLVTSQIIGETVSALIVELDSLRSCTIRNSVLCLKSVLNLPQCQEWIISGEKALIYDEIIGKLLLKSCSGPKFLCKIILEVLLLGSKELPFSRLSAVLLSLSNHKNPEVCNQIYIIACTNFLRQMNRMVTENDERTVENSLRLFQRGITSVKPEGRDMARKALKEYADRIGLETFNKEILLFFSVDQCKEIDRELKKVTIKSKSKARVPLRLLKSSNVGNTEMRSQSTGNSVAKPWVTKKANSKVDSGPLPFPPAPHAAAASSSSSSSSSSFTSSQEDLASTSFTL